jgi:hypothetical protein
MPKEAEPWVVHLEGDGGLWLYDGDGAGRPEIRLIRVTHEELLKARPRLHRALITARFKDCPRVVREPPR